MSKVKIIPVIFLGLILAGSPCWAEKAYVTDSIKITFRTGPSLENKIVTMLSSGQVVDVLETQTDWTRIRLLERGDEIQEGWVLSRYLMPRQPWQSKANAFMNENGRLKEKLSFLEGQKNEVAARERESSTTLQETAMALKNLEKEYESLKRGAADYLKLRSTYSETRTRLEAIQKEFKALDSAYDRVKSSQRNQWFITGASVLLGGLVIGLVLGRKQRKKRSSYY